MVEVEDENTITCGRRRRNYQKAGDYEFVVFDNNPQSTYATDGRLHIKLVPFEDNFVIVRAKLPLGDWIVPEIWLEPKRKVYGPTYSSGRIRIAMARGNRDLLSRNRERIDNISFEVDGKDREDLLDDRKQLSEVMGFDHSESSIWQNGSPIAPFDQEVIEISIYLFFENNALLLYLSDS
ncbi:Putative beta-1,3-glucan recognition protein 4a [Halyomorpha halys]|nr:Putative beta-1,3-glucan recognition protein 4a [Halyomorpha halys]